MLFEIMRLFREAGNRPLTREEIASRVDISPDVLDHMLLTLVQRGRLIKIDATCAGCDHCPLHRICGGPALAPKSAYLLDSKPPQHAHLQLNLT
ncbi:MAG TPA: FeoC-like transcriptional regulator [Candidatus Sulfomarinibacteraceae bacterium]|nr:FeoC-like transcriptional regulator [Candidatus Sulfomarinibacteraceae bacterium]